MMHPAPHSRSRWLPPGVALLVAAFALAACVNVAEAVDVWVQLSGDQEVPPLRSAGYGKGTITVAADRSVSGSVTTTDIAGLAANIHEAAIGKVGPVIIQLGKNGQSYSIAAGTTLTEMQLASFRAGQLYINVLTAAYPGGEIRSQLNP
jgi:hypothetical protein